MQQIIVSKLEEDNEQYLFRVKLVDDFGEEKYKVIFKKSYFEDFKSKKDPAYIVEKSFEFLLKREPKELIIKEFELSLISHYFPEYDNFVRDLK